MSNGPTSTRAYLPADRSLGVLELTAGDLLRQAAAEDPDRIALAEITPAGPPVVAGLPASGRTFTYSDLLAESERAARWLLTVFQPGEHVVVWAPNIPEWIILQYGAALAGLVLVTANPALRAEELEYVLRQSRASGLFYVDAFRGTDMAAIVAVVRPHLPLLREAFRFADWDTTVRRSEAAGELPVVSPLDPAQLQYTSGTTGFPKAALLVHQALITNAWFVHQRAGFPKHGVWATALPLFHTAGCGMSVLGTAASRGTLVLAQIFDPALLLDAAQRWRADVVGGVPAMLAAMLRHPDFDSFDLRNVKVVASGGDFVPAALIEESERRFDARFSTVYGQTELSPIVTQTSPEDSNADRVGTVGRPLWQTEVMIADPHTDEAVALGEEGEIRARGYLVMREYFDQPEETAATIDADGWLRTGDLGVLDERGYLRVTGRLKDMIIRGGENIYPAEIERVLLTHPGVAGAAVVGMPDEHWGEQVAAVIRPRDPSSPPSIHQLRALARNRLAPHKTPATWYVTETLPANAMGKIQKFILRQQITDGTLSSLPSGSER